MGESVAEPPGILINLKTLPPGRWVLESRGVVLVPSILISLCVPAGGPGGLANEHSAHADGLRDPTNHTPLKFKSRWCATQNAGSMKSSLSGQRAGH